MIYKILFEDGTYFEGGTWENSKWNEIPDKPIRVIAYQKLILENFEAYNHLVEHVVGINQPLEGIRKTILMVAYGKKVYKFTFDFIKKQIIKSEEEMGKEYNGTTTTGWKKGLYNRIPRATVD